MPVAREDFAERFEVVEGWAGNEGVHRREGDGLFLAGFPYFGVPFASERDGAVDLVVFLQFFPLVSTVPALNADAMHIRHAAPMPLLAVILLRFATNRREGRHVLRPKRLLRLWLAPFQDTVGGDVATVIAVTPIPRTRLGTRTAWPDTSLKFKTLDLPVFQRTLSAMPLDPRDFVWCEIECYNRAVVRSCVHITLLLSLPRGFA